MSLKIKGSTDRRIEETEEGRYTLSALIHLFIAFSEEKKNGLKVIDHVL